MVNKLKYLVLLILVSCNYSDANSANDVDFGDWFNAKVAELQAYPRTGGVITIAPGKYNYVVQPLVPSDFQWPLLIAGYGAELYPQGAISGLKLEQNQGRRNNVKIEGLTIDSYDQPTGVAGIMINGAWNTTVENVNIYANANVNQNWCGIIVRKSETGKSTHALWTKITDSWIRARFDPATIPCAIKLQNGANSTVIQNNEIFNTDIAIRFDETTANYSNGVVIANNSFEVGGIVFRFSHALDYTKMVGVTIKDNRVEAFKVGIAIQGRTPFVPTSIGGGLKIRGNQWGFIGKILDNPTNSYIANK